jgi:two-component system, chemotaxis family, sensor kinase CheA
MTQFSDDRGAEMRELFFETTQELLQSLNDDALRLERAPKDKEVVRSIRRTVHTLKGDAAACGFRELSDLAHMMEDALAVEDLSASVSLAELAFMAADVFAAMLVAYRQQIPVPDSTPLKKMVQNLAGSAGDSAGTPKPSGRDVAWTEYEMQRAETARGEGKKTFHVTAQVDPLCAMPIAARQLIANALESVAEILGARPEPGAAAQVKVLDLLVATRRSEAEIIAKCRIPTVIARTECFKLSTPAAKGETAKPPDPDLAAASPEKEHEAGHENGSSENHGKHAAENVLRVEAERIDNVLNLVGELIIAKSMMQQTMFEFARRYPKDTLRPRFADAMAFQSRVLSDLQRSVMKIRMVPVEQLFRRFPRMVRDAAKRCNKQVQLVLSGQDTDLDKGLLDAIAEPLTHIVRNAIGHGIESPLDRDLAGKNPTGTIRLDAYHQANQLIVEVSDDGAGIDANKLKTKALKIDLINLEEAERMSPAEALDLIFRPGFSTAEEITEISGRGVGLDVVRSVLHRLKGTVELETQLGHGTKFRLKLPLTLAIIKALLFRIEHRLYAIPLNAVAEIARAKEAEIHRVDTTEVLQLRNQVLPLARLGQSRNTNDGRGGKFFVLVTTFGERKLGLIVDALEGEEELVIKALDDQTVATDLVSGASILGDGRVVLIMNLPAVMERFTRDGTNVGQFAMPSNETTGLRSEVRQ